MVKIIVTSRDMVIEMCNMALFVFSSDDSKNLVAVWTKNLSAAERSSRVNMIIRQMNPFFIYYLNFICWYISFLHFRTFEIQFHWVLFLLYVLVCKISYFCMPKMKPVTETQTRTVYHT